MFYRIFLSPQAKRSVIISSKQGVYELPNNLRLRIRILGLRILGNKEKLEESPNLLEL